MPSIIRNLRNPGRWLTGQPWTPLSRGEGGKAGEKIDLLAAPYIVKARPSGSFQLLRHKDARNFVCLVGNGLPGKRREEQTFIIACAVPGWHPSRGWGADRSAPYVNKTATGPDAAEAM